MESWQKDQISKNIDELVKGTTCSNEIIQILVKEHVISGWDMEQLYAQREKNQNTEMSLKLYNMILCSTIPATYFILCTALELTRQTYPLEFLNRRSVNNYVISPEVESTESEVLEGATKDCTISAIVKELFDASAATAAFIIRNWTGLARKLGATTVKISTLRQQLLMNMITEQEVVSSVLKDWQIRKGKLATFETLTNALKDMNCNSIVERLHKKFSPAAEAQN